MGKGPLDSRVRGNDDDGVAEKLKCDASAASQRRMSRSPYFVQAPDAVVRHVFLQTVQYAPRSAEVDEIGAAYLYGGGSGEDVFDGVCGLEDAADADDGDV